MADDGITLDIPGMSGFLAELEMLPDTMQKRIVRGAVATGASVIRKAVIARAPMYTGDIAAGHPPPGALKKSIYQTRMSEACTELLETWKVSVRTGRASRQGKGGKLVTLPDAYYASWVEYGHYTRAPGTTSKQHRAARNSGTLGSMGATWVAPQSFMRAGFETSKTAAIQAMTDYFNDNLSLAFASYRYIQAVS